MLHKCNAAILHHDAFVPGYPLTRIACVTKKQCEADISEPKKLILDCIYLFSNICTICDSILVFFYSSLQVKDCSFE